MQKTNFLAMSTNAANGFSQVNILMALIPLIILLNRRIRLSVVTATNCLVEEIFLDTKTKTQMFSIMQKIIHSTHCLEVCTELVPPFRQ
jgi:hypothetical protein